MSVYSDKDWFQVEGDIVDLRSLIELREAINAEYPTGYFDAPESEVCEGHSDDEECEDPNGPCRACMRHGEGGDPEEMLVEAEEDEEWLKAIQALEDQLFTTLEKYAYNEPIMIADSYFEEYAEQTARELGMISDDAGWPLNHIDWEDAAEELQQDYSKMDFKGDEYWVRSY